LSSFLSCSFHIWSRIHVSKHALLVSFAKNFNLATWLPSLNLAAKFETWQPSSNLADVIEGTHGKHTETKNLSAKLELGRNPAKFKLGCQVQNLAKT
jgi:hypothetical protein